MVPSKISFFGSFRLHGETSFRPIPKWPKRYIELFLGQNDSAKGLSVFELGHGFGKL